MSDIRYFFTWAVEGVIGFGNDFSEPQIFADMNMMHKSLE